MLLAALIILLLLAVFTAYRFLKGLRIDDHPLCRRCGFDLSGLPGTSSRCSECGADLSHSRALRHGHITRSRPAAVATASLLILAAIIFTLLVVEHSTTFQINKYKPAFWLAYDARTGNHRADALDELTSRIKSGKLSPASLSSLVDYALSIQADPAIAWDTRWGDFIEFLTAASPGAASSSQLARYARQCFSIELRPDPSAQNGELVPDPTRARRGSALKMIIFGHTRAGSGLRFLAVYSTHFRIGNLTLVPLMGATGIIHIRDSLFIKLPADFALSDGPQIASADFTIRVQEPHSPAFTTTFHQIISIPLTLAPHHDSITDESYRAAIEQSVSIEKIKQAGDDLWMTVSITPSPLALVRAVILRSSKGDLLLDRFICPVHENFRAEFYIDLKKVDLPTAHFLLLHDTELADRALNSPVQWTPIIDRPLHLESSLPKSSSSPHNSPP